MCSSGKTLPGRSESIPDLGYRFGFNGKEQDNAVKGAGVQYDYGFRIYDTRIARFLSVDPLTKSYPELTPYQFAGNSPITFLDGDGREIIIYLSNGQSFKYSPFMKVPNDHFAKKVIESLNAISGTEEGSSVINQLINSDKRYHLKQSDILFNRKNSPMLASGVS